MPGLAALAVGSIPLSWCTVQEAPGLPIANHAAWVISHPLQLRSAAAAVLQGAELEFTSYHGSFLGTVDYVWFSVHPVRCHEQAGRDETRSPPACQGLTCAVAQVGPYHMRAEGVLLPPPLHSLPCGLPSAECCSDHIAVVCDFSILRLM